VRIGLNSRLDTLQAAVLLEKLDIFPDEILTRQQAADRYSQGLADLVACPVVASGNTSVWAQYTMQLDGRDQVADACKAAGVPTAIYYPIPMHRQTGYRQFPTAPGGLPVAERLAARVLSLPMHPYLDAATQDHIVATVKAAVVSGK
jgi:dTDP-4-amino-4,6-dideoxygalactose transaminase